MAENPNSSMFEDLIESGEINQAAEGALSGNSENLVSQNETSSETNQGQQQSSTGVDFETLLAEKTGGKFKSVDEILQLAEKPNNQDINFANETSKKVFEYLKEGKVDEFLNVYQQQQKLTSLDKLDTDNVLKLKMKYENPELTDEEIEDEFNYKYGIEQPDIDEDLDTPEEIAKEKKRHEREKINMERLKKKDLKEAKDFLKAKKEEIVLPDIETRPTQQSQSNAADEAEVKEFRDKYLGTIAATIDEIVGFGNKYKDSELEFETTYVIDQQDKASLQNKMENFTLQDYFVPRYINEDGNFDTEAIAHDLYVIENLDKIIEAHVSQAVNQTKSMFVKGLKNANFQEQVSRRLPDEQQASQNEMVDYFFKNT
jgi:hypothetical protein